MKSARDQNQNKQLRVSLAFWIIAILSIDVFASGNSRSNASLNSLALPRPTVLASPFPRIAIRSIGPELQRPALDRIVAAATKMLSRSTIPYVFGGKNIGSDHQCKECSACIQAKGLEPASSLERLNACQACQRCGLDCSNFVNKVFVNAGVSYDFADTRTLATVGDNFLQVAYGFVNIGADLTDAAPGDLLLEDGHIVLVLKVDLQQGRIDYAHSGKGHDLNPAGGVEMVRGESMDRLQKLVVRILRHRELLPAPEPKPIEPDAIAAVWHDLRILLAANF